MTSPIRVILDRAEVTEALARFAYAKAGLHETIEIKECTCMLVVRETDNGVDCEQARIEMHFDE